MTNFRFRQQICAKQSQSIGSSYFLALRAKNSKPKLIIIDPKARITFTSTTQRSRPKQQTRRASSRQIEWERNKHYYKQKQKQDKNYTKRKRQPKLQGNKQQISTPNKWQQPERIADHVLIRNRNQKGALKAHHGGGARKGPVEDGRWRSTWRRSAVHSNGKKSFSEIPRSSPTKCT